MTREHYLNQLSSLDAAVDELGSLVLETIQASVDSLEQRDVVRAKEIIEGDTRIDRKRHDIEQQSFLLIATQQPAARDLRVIMAAWMVASELERIGDYCSGIAKLTLTMAQEPLEGPTEDIKAMSSVVHELLATALTAFREKDVEAATVIWKRDDEVDDRYEEVFRKQIENMAESKHLVRTATYMLWVAHNLERMADRVTNIAESVAFVATGDVAAFRENLKSESVPH